MRAMDPYSIRVEHWLSTRTIIDPGHVESEDAWLDDFRQRRDSLPTALRQPFDSISQATPRGCRRDFVPGPIKLRSR
jgi:hypothetical protein